MHVTRLIQKLLLPVMHKKRLITLSNIIFTLLHNKKLSLTSLGRGMCSPERTQRSRIRIVDRFLGNKKLYKEQQAIKEAFCKEVIGNRKAPDIIVDWSNAPNTKYHVLRAAMVGKGRAITIMEDIYPERKLGNKKVQTRFLLKLKKALPEDCKPCIITDAGFHNDWFRCVLSFGWNYIGRIRVSSRKKYNDKNEWHSLEALSKKPTSKAKYAGLVQLCKSNPLETHLYTYKGRKSKKKKEKNSGSQEYRKAANEPWILASSISPSQVQNTAKQVVKKYYNRMQIEEGFRDLKSPKYGFGFRNAFSKQIQRIRILLLIAMIASYYAWIVGYVAERNKLHYQFQSSSTKKRRFLSLFFLGCEIIKSKLKIPIAMLRGAITEEFCCDS